VGYKGEKMAKPSIFEAFRMFIIGMKGAFLTAYGVLKLRQLQQPIVTVFGGTGAYEDGKYATLARAFGRKCAENNMSIITGGGPGIMAAANCGAHDVAESGRTLGIGVRGLDNDFYNPCAPIVAVDNFFGRKWLLTRYSQAFVWFPGGIGTLDEFTEVSIQIKLKKMDKVPIILFGISYWKSFVEWYQHAFDYDFIELAPQNAFIVVDNIDDAMAVIINSIEERKSNG
jgi:uncharacterized protein (TIGR00730 family)